MYQLHMKFTFAQTLLILVGRSVEITNEIRADIMTRDFSTEVQRTFMLTYVLFMVVIQCHFPQIADGFGNSVKAWGPL